jgi:hypothetical protein
MQVKLRDVIIMPAPVLRNIGAVRATVLQPLPPICGCEAATARVLHLWSHSIIENANSQTPNANEGRSFLQGGANPEPLNMKRTGKPDPSAVVHFLASKLKDFDLVVCQYNGLPTASAAVQERRVVVFTEFDNAESLISSIYDNFSISGRPKLLLFYQRPPHDPDEEVPFRQITPQAVAGSLLHFLATGDAQKLFTLPDDDQIDLAFTVPPQLEGAAAAGARGPAAAVSAPSVNTAAVTPSAAASGQQGNRVTPAAGSSAGSAAQSTVKSGYRAGKSPQLPWMDYAKELCRNNLIRGNDGTYYLITDKVPEPGKSCHVGLPACRSCMPVLTKKAVNQSYELP